MTPKEALWSPFAAEGLERRVYVLDDERRPHVVLMHELPGLTPQCLGLLESTVRYLGIEVDDALEISEQTEI